MIGLRAAFFAAVMLLAFGHQAVAERQYAAIVVDHASGRVLHESAADLRLFPASLTKMMTLYMLFDAIEAGRLSLKTKLRVSRRAEGMPASKLGLTAGNTIRVEDAVLALTTKSANDAAVVIGEALGGSEAAFAHAMTRRARQIGMTRTVFRNASGLPDDEQVSTARDMATLARRLIVDHGRFYDYFSRGSFRYGSRVHRSHNRLMARYEGMDGLKTGYIRASGYNLAASALRGGRRVIAVVFGGRTADARDDEVARLLDLGFERLGDRDEMLIAGPPRPRPEAGPAVPPALTAAVAADAASAQSVLESAAARPALEEALEVAAIEAGAASSTLPVVAAPADDPALPRARPGGLKLRQGAPKAEAQGEYGVQVGAYHDPESARRRAYQITRHAPDLLLQGDVQVSALQGRRGMVYRARFVGLGRNAALQACKALKRKRVDCLVIHLDPLQLARN